MTTPDLSPSGDGTERWIEAGSGDPLVLVHGIGGAMRTWLPVLGDLSADHRVIAWALPGYDDAEPLQGEDPRAGDYASRLLALMDRLDLPSAHLVGHSLGAVIVAALAKAAPRRVSRLSLICPVAGMGSLPAAERSTIHDGRSAEIRGGSMRAFAEARTASIVGPGIDAGALREIVDTMASIPAPAYLQAWAMMCASDTVDLLAGHDGPAMVAGGEADPVAPPVAVSRIAGALSVTANILPAVGHFPTHEATRDLLALLRAPA